jgi:hypothetical protein
MTQNNESENHFFRSLDEKLDKRTKILHEKIKKTEEQLIGLETNIRILENKNFDKLCEDLHDLEIRIKTIEVAQGGHDQNWKMFFNFIIQVVWVVMAAYILLKLGLQSPP